MKPALRKAKVQTVDYENGRKTEENCRIGEFWYSCRARILIEPSSCEEIGVGPPVLQVTRIRLSAITAGKCFRGCDETS